MGKEIRIGDTERNESRALLDIHLAEGRLTIAEHEERLTLAGVAQTRAALEELFADLPTPHPDQPSSGATSSLASAVFAMVAVSAFFLGVPVSIVVVIVTGIWWPLVAANLLMAVSMGLAIALDKPGTTN